VLAPGETAAHREPALKVRVRARGAEEHHLAAQQAASERRGRSRRVDGELEQHARAMMVDAGQRDVPPERHELAARVASLFPARASRRRVEAQREVSGYGVDLVAEPNARRPWKVVVGVGAVVASIQIVEREGVEARTHELPQHAHVGEDDDEGERSPGGTAAEKAVDEVRRDSEVGSMTVGTRQREPGRITPIGHVWIAFPVVVTHALAPSSDGSLHARVLCRARSEESSDDARDRRATARLGARWLPAEPRTRIYV